MKTPIRVCTCCKQEKPATAEHFHVSKRTADGRREVCRACRAADHAANRDVRLQARRTHYAENRDRLNATSKEYYRNNIEAQQAAGRNRHHKNRDLRIVQMNEYRVGHREELNARRRPKAVDAFHTRYRVDQNFTLRHRVRALVCVSLKKARKSHRMIEILGYDTGVLRSHIESLFVEGMSWERFMRGEIHIDHIIPISRFDITSDTCAAFKECWALSNLRPMWAKDNLSKGAKTAEEYEQACMEH